MPVMRAAALLALACGLVPLARAAAPAYDPDSLDAPAPPEARQRTWTPMQLEHRGLLGDYHMTRDASGTSWQPEAVPMEGWHGRKGSWRLMAHGRATGGVTTASGPRGVSQGFTTSMLMAQARRDEGPRTLALRAMGSLEPVMSARGYPELLQSGETADGRTLLIDRQHPHDAIMELSVLYSVRQDAEHPTLFIYGGLPGEPAVGPPAFMHRASGQDNPQAPIGHHWQDSTHVSYGVVTVGAAGDRLKVEATAFRGREPDRFRWDIEKPDLDSFGGRVSFNPSAQWSFQAGVARIKSPDALAPGVDTLRFTASAMNYTRAGDGGLATTAVLGLNDDTPGSSKASVLLESSWTGGPQTVFGRFEWVQKDELLLALGGGDPLVRQIYPNGIGAAHLPSDPSAPGNANAVVHAPIFSVGRLGFGGVRDIARAGPVTLGVGASFDLDFVPPRLRGAYGSLPVDGLVWLRALWDPARR
jgi:hypothetical protein